MSPLQSVLITGARGLLGQPLVRCFKLFESWQVIPQSREQLDITDQNAVDRVMKRELPRIVINCAAFTKVDACEGQMEWAERVNGAGAGIVAEAAARIDARLIHISTDYVFDGTSMRPYKEEDQTAPPDSLCAYGKSKLTGEREVVTRHPSPLIIRTSWVFGEDGPCFPKTILRLAKERPELRIVHDQIGAPTYARDLADAIFHLASMQDVSGIMHITNSGTCSWYELACEVLRLAAINTPVQPIKTAEFPLPAKRPQFSGLDNSRFVQTTGKALRNWREAVSDFVDRETSRK